MPEDEQPDVSVNTKDSCKIWLKSFLWPSATILLAGFIVFCFVFFNEFRHGTTQLKGIIHVWFGAHRICEVTLVLLSALIVEQLFSGPNNGILIRAVIVFEFLMFFGIIALSTIHNVDTYSHYDYENQFQKGSSFAKAYEKYDSCFQESHTVYDSMQYTILKEMVSDSLKYYWKEVDTMNENGEERLACNCQFYSFSCLFVVFCLSIYARRHLLLKEKKLRTKINASQS